MFVLHKVSGWIEPFTNLFIRMDVISDIQKLKGLVKKTSCIATTGNGCLNHHAIHYVAFPFGSFGFYFLTLKDLIEDLKVALCFISSQKI